MSFIRYLFGHHWNAEGWEQSLKAVAIGSILMQPHKAIEYARDLLQEEDDDWGLWHDGIQA